jgi:hypothetical protein
VIGLGAIAGGKGGIGGAVKQTAGNRGKRGIGRDVVGIGPALAEPPLATRNTEKVKSLLPLAGVPASLSRP